MSITTLISQSELIALGWTLLHFCWQGTAIAVAYAVVDRLTSRASTNVRYAVALIALALMPLVVAATYSLELQVAQQQVAASFPTATITDLPARHVVLQEIALTTEPNLTPALAARSAWLLNRAQLALPFIDILWMLGVLLLAIRAAGGWLQLERIRQQAANAIPPEIELAFHRMSHRLNIGREVALRISGEVISPLAMGLWHTTVILPMSAVLRLSAAELEAVLAHELGHIRRWDYAVNLLQTAIESILFFHPAVWRLSHTVRERREICCDEIAVLTCANPIVYAQALLRMEEHRTISLRAAVALEGCGGSLLERVRKILGEPRPMENMDSKMTSGVRVAAAATIVMALLLGPMLFDSKTSTAVAAPHISTPTIAALPAEPAASQSPAPAAAPAPTTPVAEPAPVPEPTVAPIAPMPDLIPMATPAPKVKVKVAPIDLDSQVDINLNVDIPKVKLKELQQLKDIDIKLKGKEIKAMNEQMKIQSKNMELMSRDMAVKSKDIQLSIMSANNRMMLDAGLQSADGKPSPSGAAYIDGMKDAGYPLDLNNDLHSLIALKSVGVTPEYAKAMNNVGLGKPTAHDLITLKAMGVTPEYVATLKQQGVTPLTIHDVISMKAQRVSPEYITWFKQHFPDAPMNEMRRASIFHLDDQFLAQAKAHGFDEKNLDKLIRLKISGLLND
jgi:beta-lactamase regulating signal transducer with metallopeptidase domain